MGGQNEKGLLLGVATSRQPYRVAPGDGRNPIRSSSAAFRSLHRLGHLLNRRHVPLAVLLKHRFPGRLEETQQMPGPKIRSARLGERHEVRLVVIVAAGRYLVI